jgi:hypothetical protein
MSNDVFTFSYTPESHSKFMVMLEAPEDGFQPWTEVLDRFVDFLGTVYGYDIKSKIRVQYSPVMEVDDYWRGEFFDVPEDDEDEQVDEKAGLTE